MTDKLQGRTRDIENYISELTKQLDDLEAEKGAVKVLLATSRPGVSGVMSATARACRRLEENGKICLWLDMNDISSTDNLFEVLLEAIYYRLGVEDWIPSVASGGLSTWDAPQNQSSAFDAPQDPRQREINRLICSVNKKWVIFLNGYETPGANLSDDQSPESNGWLDHYDSTTETNASKNGLSRSILGRLPFWRTPRELERVARSKFSDKSDCAKSLIALIRALTGPNSKMSVIMLTRNRNFFYQEESSLRINAPYIELPASTHPSGDFFNERHNACKALEWASDDPDKRKFLYALVLMQRPRHLATLWGSALNAVSVSNSDKRLTWVTELEDKGVIRRKYGGLIWLHSPCRQIIRRILSNNAEEIESVQKGTMPEGMTPAYVKKLVSNVITLEETAAIHRDIAEWYEQVLDASEAPGAAFEAASHYCKASLAFLGLNVPEYGRAEAYVEAAASLLNSNSFLIQTHGYSRGSCRLLEGIAESGTTIANKIKELQQGSLKTPKSKAQKQDQHEVMRQQQKVIEAVRRMWIVCAEIMRAIAREVGEDAKSYFRHRQVGRLLSKTADWNDVQSSDRKYQVTSMLRKEFPSSSELGPKAGWLRWRRWCGMLAIASRSYDVARRIFEAELGPFETKPNKSELRIRVVLVTQSQRLEFLHLIEQSVQLMLLEVSALLRTSGIGSGEKVKEILLQAYSMIQRGKKLARKMRSADHRADAPDIILANWCLARLLMHASLVECHNRVLQFDNPSSLDAMGILSDAEAILRVAAIGRSRSELALVDLHRANIKLHEAEFVLIKFDGEDIPVSDLVAKLGNFVPISNQSISPSFTAFWTAIHNKIADANCLIKASAIVADSIRFLNRAEPVLRERRRNVYWTTWFFERKLRAIALSIAVSVFDTGTPIPFLGLEAAMRTTDTEADSLLTDACRMIRVDSYRLASVISAYMSCIRALNMRLRLDAIHNSAQEVSLPRRYAKMLENLEKACITLKAVVQRRQEDYGYNDDNSKPARFVLDYIAMVETDANTLLAGKLSTRRYRGA